MSRMSWQMRENLFCQLSDCDIIFLFLFLSTLSLLKLHKLCLTWSTRSHFRLQSTSSHLHQIQLRLCSVLSCLHQIHLGLSFCPTLNLVIVVYFSHFSNIFYTCYSYFLCTFHYVFFMIFLNPYDQFYYLKLFYLILSL